MKKVISLTLSICFVLCLASCNDKKNTEDGTSNVTQVTLAETPTDSPNTDSPEQNTNEFDSNSSNNTENSGYTTNLPDNTGEAETSKPETPTHTHSYSNATCTEPSKCSCGSIKDSALGHTWTNATCTAPKTCSVCKTTEGKANGHTWTNATCTAPKTCSICKTTEGNANGHTWTNATCTAPKTCSACKTTEGNALGHNYNKGICSLCGNKDNNYTEPPQSNVILSDFMGKTVGDVKRVFGNNFEFTGFSGSTAMYYSNENICFILDSYYSNPNDTHKIKIVSSSGNIKTIGKLDGKMTYPEIVAAIGSQVNLSQPDYFFYEMYGMWIYSLSFYYKDYSVLFEWSDNPETNASDYCIVQPKPNQTPSAPETTPPETTPPETTPPETTPPLSEETKIIIDKIKKCFENSYYGGFEVLSIDVYHENDSILVLTINTTNEYALYGVNYYKDTRVYELYNTGNFVFRDTLP